MSNMLARVESETNGSGSLFESRRADYPYDNQYMLVASDQTLNNS
jgi:hypothetical protein